MKRILSVLLAAAMLLSLTACGGEKEPEDKVELMSTLSDTGKALGYDLLDYNTSGSTLELESTAVVNDNIGQATYQNGKSTVTLRMTLDREKAEGLAGYRNAGTAGAIEAPTDVFSKLCIQVVDNSTYFCEFTYTSCGCPCYLSLAETKTNLDLYSVLLIDYVNQLYNLEGIPSYVLSVDPSLSLDPEAPELSESDASASAESEAEQTQTEETQPEPEPDEENPPAQQATEQKSESEEKTEQKSESEEKTEQKSESEEKTEQKSESEEKTEQKSESEEKTEQKSESEEKTEQKSESEEKTEQKSESEENTEQKSDSEQTSGKKDSKKKAEGKITLTYYDITLVHVGDAYTFEPKGGDGSYKWKSADPKIASVSENGTVKATGKGTTKVTVTSGDGLSAEVIVRVPGK